MRGIFYIFYVYSWKMRIARKCSYCGKLGHNARTCKNVSHGQLKLFGVRLDVYSSSSSSNSFSSSPASCSATKRSFSTNYFFSSSESLSSSYPSPSLFGTNENSDSYLVSAEDSLISTILDTNKGYMSIFFSLHIFSSACWVGSLHYNLIWFYLFHEEISFNFLKL